MPSRVRPALGLGALAVAFAASLSLPANAAVGPTVDEGRDAAGTCYSNIDDLDVFRTMSQNFAPILDPYDSAAADDVRLKKRCTVRSVQVVGAYSAENAVDSETVTFYKNKNGRPAKVIDSQTVVGEDDAGSFDIPIEPVRLNKGTYWVSVVANLDAEAGGQWYWTNSTNERGAAALWQNPRGGWQYGCLSWTKIQECLGSDPGDDLSFALRK